MSVWKRWMAGLAALSLLFPAAPVAGEETADPLENVWVSYRLLKENHLSRPSERQLVQGALQRVAEELNAGINAGISVSPTDDTLSELNSRLNQWRTAHRVDGRTMARWAVDGMVAGLNDPYTQLLTDEEMEQFQQELENEAVGFGIRLRPQSGNLIILDVLPDSPAEAAGLEAGDYLFAVDGVRLKDLALEEAYALLRGEAGSEAELTVYKPALKQLVTKKLMRKRLEIPEVTGARFAGDIGYLQVTTFGTDAALQFRDELDELRKAKQPLKGLVIDLRDNGGGYLHTARDIASLLMEEGVLLYMIDRSGIRLPTWVRNGRPVDVPVRILVNGDTASASEVLAGALQDHGIARLVGTRTYGKGSSQQIVPLPEGDALKVTLHEYVTPANRAVNGVGLSPDIPSPDEVGQVIDALASLGVKAFEVRESVWGEVQVNGVSFAVAEPVFRPGPKGLTIRAAVMASLTGDANIGSEGYVSLDTYKQHAGRGIVQTGANWTSFQFVRK